MLIGRVDRVPGVCYVATDVVEVAWIPLWPRATWLVEEGSETHGRYYRSRLTALFDDTIEATAAVRPGTEVHAQQWRGQRLPFSGRSFGRGLATRLALVGGIGLALATPMSLRRDSALGLIPVFVFLALAVGSRLVQMFGRIRTANTMRAAALAIIGGALATLPWWLLPAGVALAIAGWAMRAAPLADPVRAAELGKLLGAPPAKIREAIAASGKRAPVPRAKVTKPAAPPKPKPVPVPVPQPRPAPSPQVVRDPADGPRFLL